MEVFAASLTNTVGYQRIGELILQKPSEFSAQESADAMQLLTPGLPTFLAAGYIALVFGGQRFMKNKEPLNLKNYVTFWNLLLALFSIAGAIVTVPVTIQVLGSVGFDSTAFKGILCTPPDALYDGTFGYWIYLFILSKVPELLDTVFLVLQKKPVIFLHWYHHFTVMLYCWFCWTEQTGPRIYFGSMNFSVHAIMYSYYFLMCFKPCRPLVKPLAPLITSLQILQMVGGIIISGYAYVAHTGASESSSPCEGLESLNVKLGMIMYVSYFILFSMLFYKSYLRGGGKKQHRHIKK